MQKIVVVGSINMDSTFLVDKLPARGETILSKKKINAPGGKGANQAASIAKLGGEVKLIGCVGNDENGDLILSKLEQYKVNCDYVRKVNDTSTGQAFICVSQEGSNFIVVDSGSNELLDTSYIESLHSVLRDADYCVMQLEIPDDTANSVIDYCKKNNTRIILNYSPAQNREVNFHGIDYMIVNETELEACIEKNFCEIEEHDIKSFISRSDIKWLILTLGKHGVSIYSKDITNNYAATDDNAIDPTGAGDSFLGAFVFALSENKNTEDAVDFAQRCAGFTVTRYGAMEAMPTIKDIG